MAINYEKFILDEKVNKIKSYDSQWEDSVLSESITDIYIRIIALCCMFCLEYSSNIPYLCIANQKKKRHG